MQHVNGIKREKGKWNRDAVRGFDLKSSGFEIVGMPPCSFSNVGQREEARNFTERWVDVRYDCKTCIVKRELLYKYLSPFTGYVNRKPFCFVSTFAIGLDGERLLKDFPTGTDFVQYKEDFRDGEEDEDDYDDGRDEREYDDDE